MNSWIYFKSHGSLHANERFWVSLHVLYVLIKHCCAMFAFLRGCDRYEHAKVCIPRIALPVSQMNQVSLWITIKRAQEREVRRTWVIAKGQELNKVAIARKIETLICPLPPRIHQTRQDPSITETSSILQHIMEAARPVKKHSRSHTLSTINSSPPLPCTLSATCLSLAASERRRTCRVPAEGFL